MDRLVLATAAPGYFLVGSTSTTVYILDLVSPRPRMMRSTVPGASTSRAWWDNQWAPLVSVESVPEGGRGVIAVGSRVRWVADPGGRAGANEWCWVSREVVSIELVSGEGLQEFLLGRASSADKVGAVFEGNEDGTDAIMRDPKAVASIQEGLAHHQSGRTFTAGEARATLALRAAMADRRRRNAARRAQLKGDLTERTNAAIEKSGQDEDDLAWVTEMSHQLLREIPDDWGTSPKPIAIQQVVTELNGQLSAPLVATLSGAPNSEEPHSWGSGTTQPDEDAATRLRAAYGLWHLLAADESEDVARACFIGHNPALGGDNLATALREDRIEEAFAAVRAFLTDGWAP